MKKKSYQGQITKLILQFQQQIIHQAVLGLQLDIILHHLQSIQSTFKIKKVKGGTLTKAVAHFVRVESGGEKNRLLPLHFLLP
jgi:hypothetical protein